jgi:hypothetical protein
MQSAGGRPADARPGARAPFKCCRGRAEEAEVVAFSSKLSCPAPVALGAALALAAAALAAIAAPADAGVRTASTVDGKAERVKTLPISKRPWAEARSIMSVGPEGAGELIAGDRLEAAGDFEISVCLKPNPRHPGNGHPCVGDIYSYNPTIRAKLVLAPSESATASAATEQIGRTQSLTCTQNLPARNHHCVVSVPWSGFKIKDPASLPCRAADCHINMVVSAFHPSAGSGEKVVVGSSDDKKRIQQGLAKLNVVRHRPGKGRPSKVWRGGRATKKVPIVREGGDIKRTVIYSAKVSRLKPGDQLVVDARARVGITHLPYNVFQRTEVVFANTKHSTKASGKVLGTTGRASASNGINCTQGGSAHARICDLRKSGVLSVSKKAKGPFYVNLVVGQQAIGIDSQTAKWRASHRGRVKKTGYVRVERYSGSSVCKTCSTGWTRFSAKDRPSSGKVVTLLNQLAPFGITSGSYNCTGRSDGNYVCKWRSEGRFGKSPKYKCETRATMRKGNKRFNLKVCKDALGAQLWNELFSTPTPVVPSFTGSCNEQKNGDFKCNWFGDAATGPKAGGGCKGHGVYDRGKHRWKIDSCRPM